MLTINPKYITDENGKKISVVLPIKEFNELMAQLEELQDIRSYDRAKEVNEPSIPIEKAFEIIEGDR